MKTFTITFQYPDEAGKLLVGQQLFNFWSRVDVGAEDACWPWRASGNSLGYGRFRVNGRLMLAHRVALLDVSGEPDGKSVAMHSCHHRACCNPAHLSFGTQKQNIKTAVDAGRVQPPQRRARLAAGQPGHRTVD